MRKHLKTAFYSVLFTHSHITII